MKFRSAPVLSIALQQDQAVNTPFNEPA